MLTVKNSASGSDLAATTDDFASMAVTASASGSRHRTAPAPRPGSPSMEWDDFEEPTEAPPPLSETSGNDPTKPYQLTKHEAEKHFKPMGVQPAPSESGSNDPTGTNKGKTRERDPSSSSPEEEASGQKKKPDAKKPRRAGRLR